MRPIPLGSGRAGTVCLKSCGKESHVHLQQSFSGMVWHSGCKLFYSTFLSRVQFINYLCVSRIIRELCEIKKVSYILIEIALIQLTI